MTTQDQIYNLQGHSADLQKEIDKLSGFKAGIDLAIETLTDGYKSDQAAIDEAIAAKLEAAKEALSK